MGKIVLHFKKNRGGRNTQINKTIRIYIESTWSKIFYPKNLQFSHLVTGEVIAVGL